MLMKVLQAAVCSSKDCDQRWAPEVFNEACAADDSCALRTIRHFSRCSGSEGCGWSLNLFKHQRAGLRLWPQIVEIMAAQPMTVIFLTRRDFVAQFVSYDVGARRKEVMQSAEYKQNFGRGLCNAYQFYNCPRSVVKWVQNRSSFAVDLRQMHDEVLRSRREARIYSRLEAELRERKAANLTIMHLTYEDLRNEDAWTELSRVAGLPAVQHPRMLDSDYSGFISNWADVAAYARITGVTA